MVKKILFQKKWVIAAIVIIVGLILQLDFQSSKYGNGVLSKKYLIKHSIELTYASQYILTFYGGDPLINEKSIIITNNKSIIQVESLVGYSVLGDTVSFLIIDEVGQYRLLSFGNFQDVLTMSPVIREVDSTIANNLKKNQLLVLREMPPVVFFWQFIILVLFLTSICLI